MDVDNGNKVSMKESIFHVVLVNGPSFLKSQTKNNLDRTWFDDKAKSLTTVNSNFLSFSITYKKGFMPLKRTINTFFMSKNPHGTHNININRAGYQLPRLIFNKSIKLIKHSQFPIRVLLKPTQGTR